MWPAGSSFRTTAPAASDRCLSDGREHDVRNFWQTSGYQLLRRNDAGRLVVTEDFLRAYLLRPELAPVEESCDAERALHDGLLEQPARTVEPEEIAALADEDARDNYATFLRFRDVLLAHDTLESAYLALFRNRMTGIPALFVDQIVHAVLRNVLDGTADALQARAAELMFRTQKVTIREHEIMVADEETVELHAARDDRDGLVQFDHLAQLISSPEPHARTVELDILDPRNAEAYWERSDRFDMVLDVAPGKPGLDAFCRVLEAWLLHFLGLDATIFPLQAINDERWRWHVGLDAEATAILNALYEGAPLSEEANYRLLALFRAEFRDSDMMRPPMRGMPVYMAMAMTGDGRLRIRPQNLLMNLPLAEAA